MLVLLKGIQILCCNINKNGWYFGSAQIKIVTNLAKAAFVGGSLSVPFSGRCTIAVPQLF
jgi:hypothetical protein